MPGEPALPSVDLLGLESLHRIFPRTLGIIGFEARHLRSDAGGQETGKPLAPHSTCASGSALWVWPQLEDVTGSTARSGHALGFLTALGFLIEVKDT